MGRGKALTAPRWGLPYILFYGETLLNRLLTAAAALAVIAGSGAAPAFAQTAEAAAGSPAATGAATQAPAAGPAAGQVKPAGDLLETARASGQFNTFVKAVNDTNLTQVLKTAPNLTVFAPTDAAFAALPPGELQRLQNDKAALQKLITHHIINTRVDSSKIKGAKGPVPSVAGDQVVLDGSGDALKADNATIVQADVSASNGILHVVDQVLTPGAASASASAAGASASAPAPAAEAPASAK